MSCFVFLFSVLFRLQLSVVRPSRSQFLCLSAPSHKIGFSVLKPILCEGALRHRNTRELYLNNFRAVGLKHVQLKAKQNRKQNLTKQDTGIKTRQMNN